MATFEMPIYDLDARNRTGWLNSNFTNEDQKQVSCLRWAALLAMFFFNHSQVNDTAVRGLNKFYFR